MASKTVGEVQSPSGRLNATDWKKTLKGLGIGAAGALLTFLASYIPGMDLGKYTLVLIPLFSTLVNLGLKWYAGQPKE